jgi:cephalosporin hydroxylase
MPVFEECWYYDDQIVNLCKLAKKVKDLSGLCIEIGCWEGKSTVYLTNTLYPETLICNDTWLGNIEESNVTGTEHPSVTLAKQKDVYSRFLQNMNEVTKGNFVTVRQDCLEWLKTLKEPVKFCHIDASHDYESVYKTIELLKPLVVPGGILCGDDYLTANIRCKVLQGGVQRAVMESFDDFEHAENLWYWINE